MNLVVFDVDGTLIQSTGVDDEFFSRAVEVAWSIPNISTLWDDYQHVTDSGIATELFQKHFGREPEPAELEALQQEFLSQLENAVRGTTIPQTPSVAAVLQRLQHHERWRAAIATGSWARPIALKLQAAGLSLSSLPMATSDDAFDRAEVIQIAANRAKEVYGQQGSLRARRSGSLAKPALRVPQYRDARSGGPRPNSRPREPQYDKAVRPEIGGAVGSCCGEVELLTTAQIGSNFVLLFGPVFLFVVERYR